MSCCDSQNVPPTQTGSVGLSQCVPTLGATSEVSELVVSSPSLEVLAPASPVSLAPASSVALVVGVLLDSASVEGIGAAGIGTQTVGESLPVAMHMKPSPHTLSLVLSGSQSIAVQMGSCSPRRSSRRRIAPGSRRRRPSFLLRDRPRNTDRRGLRFASSEHRISRPVQDRWLGRGLHTCKRPKTSRVRRKLTESNTYLSSLCFSWLNYLSSPNTSDYLYILVYVTCCGVTHGFNF